MLRLFLWGVAGVAAGGITFEIAHRILATERKNFFTSGTLITYVVLLAIATATVAFYWEGARCALAVCALWAAAFHSLTDLCCGYIYDRAVIVSLVLAIVARIFWQGTGAFYPLGYGAMAGWIPLALIIFVSRQSMGWGDANMMGGVGAFLGWKLTLLSLYAGFIVGGATAGVLLLTGRVKRRDALPMAPFLAIGVFLALVFGRPAVSRLGLFLDF